MWTTVSCQKFHNTGTLGRLFQVSGDAPVEVAGEEGDADDNRYDFKRWLNRIGWARHLKPLKREWLLHMAKKPAHNERALSDVRWAVEMVIWRAQQVSHSSVVGMTAVMYIN
ncbi:hypothetical protein ACJQWK_10444 [Exserohilum turcicum]